MAVNTFLKPDVIAPTALGLLERELVLSNLVWTNPGLDFTGAKNDTVTIRVPARTMAHNYALRNDRTNAITLDTLAEDSIAVQLTQDVYSAVPVTDEELTLDISDFGSQILDPQVRAVAAYMDAQVAAMITGAAYVDPISATADTLLGDITAARKQLNVNDVPQQDRTLLVGADFEEALLNADNLLDVSQSGSDGALRDATIGRLRGFNVVVSNAIDAGDAYAFVPSAFILATRAPAIPQGAAFGSGASFAGYAMRWVKDYDAMHMVDRSVVNAYMGTQVVLDQAVPGVPASPSTSVLKRAVKLSLSGGAGS